MLRNLFTFRCSCEVSYWLLFGYEFSRAVILLVVVRLRIFARSQYILLLYGKVNPSVLIGSFLVGISPYGPFPWQRSEAVYFLFSKAGKLKTSMVRVPYNKLLTNLASSSRTGEYWPSVVFVPTSLRSVRTATTSGQYSPVRPSRLVSKRLLYAGLAS